MTEALARVAVRPGERTIAAAKTGLLLAVLFALSLFLRTRAFDAGYWIDEGLSIGIASFPLAEIPGVLRQDGSPPLYYALLHVWIDWFGTSERATHALSLVFALAAIPVALWAGWSLFGRRAGWVAAVLAALNPFLTIYAQETRMYSLVILLSLLVSATFLHAFVFRRRGYLPAFAVALVALLYTHNWGLFFAVGSVAALAVVWRASADRPALARDAGLAYGAVALAFVPWLPTLVDQARHTGAPWSNTPSPVELVGGIMIVLAGQGALVALVFGALVGVHALLRAPEERVRTAVAAALVLTFATLVGAWLFSQVSTAWANRYLGVLIGPTLLAAAALLPRAGRLGAVALGFVVVFWLPFSATTTKSNVDELAALYGGVAGPEDVVLVTQPEQVSVVAHYFGHDHRYATPLGPVPDTRVMDWRNAVERLEAARPETTLEPILAGLDEGRRVVLLRPVFRDAAQWRAPWTRLVRRKTELWTATLAADPRFRRTQAYAPPYTGRVHRLPLALEVFEKTAPG